MNLSTHGHRLQPIGARKLHPTEASLVLIATARGEWVRTCTVARWKKSPPPSLDKIPTVFLLLAD